MVRFRVLTPGALLPTLVLSAVALVHPSPSAAQSGRLSAGGMDLHLFRPAVDSKGHLSVNGTEVLGHGDLSFGLVLDGGFGLVPFDAFVNSPETQADDARRCGGRGDVLCGRLVDAMLTGTLSLNLGLANALAVGVQVPVVVGTGPDLTIPGVYNDPPGATRGLDHQSLGNVGLHGKLRLLRAERNAGLGLAAIVQLELPTGRPARFAGDPDFVLWPHFVGEWRPARGLRASLDLGYRFVAGAGAVVPIGGRTEPGGAAATMARLVDGTGSGFAYDDQVTFGLGAGARLGDAPVELTAELYGAWILAGLNGQPDLGDRPRSSFARGVLNLEALLGLKVFVDRSSYLVLAGGGALPTGGATQADVRGVVGFLFEPSIGDRDGDGLRDDIDRCLAEPEDHDGFADEDGCPDPDNDRDGLVDRLDECPLIPEDRDGDADGDGCPEGNEGDRDGDGLLDTDDRCPDEPEDRDGFRDDDGCPDTDNDEDGIPDTDDLCPLDAEDADGFDDQDGCPDPDNDADRILDVDDACPDDPETNNGHQDDDGCPDSVLVRGRGVIWTLRPIAFATDSARLLPASFPVLEEVAAALIADERAPLIEVQGHADERGSDAYNLRLTRDRAAAVLEALVQRGVPRSRLTSRGFGERCPVNEGHGPVAWAANRRVEFHLLDDGEDPTGDDLECPAERPIQRGD